MSLQHFLVIGSACVLSPFGHLHILLLTSLLLILEPCCDQSPRSAHQKAGGSAATSTALLDLLGFFNLSRWDFGTDSPLTVRL